MASFSCNTGYQDFTIVISDFPDFPCVVFSYTRKLPGAGGIQYLREISPPLTVVKVVAPGPYIEPGHCAGLFSAGVQVKNSTIKATTMSTISDAAAERIQKVANFKSSILQDYAVV